MGALKYIITVESDTPPKVMLGQSIFGGEVVGLTMEKIPTLVSVAWLVEKYGMTKATIIKRLDGFNQGSDGKFMYDSKTAIAILSQSPKSKRGAKRVN
ncbi:hypothetical protein QR665_09455 [Acinetobacter gerneri]|uniref:hypothetical protein n=1 Tax=Acinetobacter gerneri TaxID=202952 RepID=UPI002935EAB8|nr:hypothetical protein [Acinetobacter gerneri]MDV2439695.1 hypothetical protein [Acinetobacter gerneri]